jgi:hypothetical protein
MFQTLHEHEESEINKMADDIKEHQGTERVAFTGYQVVGYREEF